MSGASKSRRQFLAGSLAAGATLALSRRTVLGQVLGANDRIRIAVAGINGRGKQHLDAYARMKDVEIACLIDPDSRLFDGAIKNLQKKGCPAPKTVQDVRKALEDKNLDAISIATPNHWHSLMTAWACQAGKDVYVEKPLGHNYYDGLMAVAAARKYDRIVQHGTQRRSEEGWARTIAAIHSGKLGKLLVARGLCYKPRKSIGFKEPVNPPAELDFDHWLGPCPRQPYHENLVHYNWHWFWPTGNGDIGNQGVHQFDVARWGIKGATLPKTVISLGGRFGYKDQAETPNTQIAVYDFDGIPMIFEVRGLDTDDYQRAKIGNIFELEAGTVVETRFYPKGSSEPAPLPNVEWHLADGDIFRNFINVLKSRKRADLNNEVLEGHYSSALCHLANVSYRVGQEVPFDVKKKVFADDKVASDALGRMEEHLAKAGVQLADSKYRLGKLLHIQSEQGPSVLDVPAANDLLMGKGQYREPYVFPKDLI